MGTNGVIHVIDAVLIPESARPLTEALDEAGVATMKELLETADLTGEEFMSNATIFAPSERAWNALPEGYLDDLKGDKERLRQFLLYHTAAPKTCKCEFENNKMLQTLARDEEKRLRINAYEGNALGGVFGGVLPPAVSRGVSTVQCARLTALDEEACGAMVHTVDKVLLPPGGNTVEVLKNNGRFGKFMELLEFSELENDLLTAGQGHTILAPTDDAFDAMHDDLKETYLTDKDVAARLVENHVVNDVVCCAGIPLRVPFFDRSGRRTRAGDVVSLRKSQGGHIYADKSEVITCDMVANNGVVHALDRLLVPKDLQREEPAQGKKQTELPFYIIKLFK